MATSSPEEAPRGMQFLYSPNRLNVATSRAKCLAVVVASPSLFALVYYINMKAALDGLEAVKGDLSGGQKKYREALSKMTLKTPTGDVKLDKNRQAIGSTFITEVVKDSKGNLYNKVLRKVDGIDQMLGMKPSEFKMGSRDEPSCP